MFGPDWQHRQRRIEDALRYYLHTQAATAPRALVEAMEYSLLAPGKRLRPMLVLLACEAAGGTIDQALPAAGAVEMVHTYSLIHDDLPAMDDDDLRRGLPTCHKKFGEALAILAGDALLTLAFEVLAISYAPATATVMVLELAQGAGAVGMVGGQVLDLAAEDRLLPTRQPIERTIDGLEGIHRRKTGALFRASLRLGVHAAAVGRADQVQATTLQRLDRYAHAFGLAFQITDDLLDVEGDASKLGKRAGKDAPRGKLTYPGLLGVAESRRRARQLADEAIDVVTPLGQAGQTLAELMRGVIERDR